MNTIAYLTLADGTLLDLELEADGRIVVHAGRSLVPAERPAVCRLTFADLLDLNRAAVDLFQRFLRRTGEEDA